MLPVNGNQKSRHAAIALCIIQNDPCYEHAKNQKWDDLATERQSVLPFLGANQNVLSRTKMKKKRIKINDAQTGPAVSDVFCIQILIDTEASGRFYCMHHHSPYCYIIIDCWRWISMCVASFFFFLSLFLYACCCRLDSLIHTFQPRNWAIIQF